MPDYIGRYRTERVLGSGAFALVWLAVDEALDAHVAIKVLAENWAQDEGVRQRFADEARILWRADSDHIVRVHTVEELPDGRPYFVMDYADRGSLDTRMRERAAEGYSFHVHETVQITLDIADGLAVAHALGIVHRDLKPSNVLFQSLPAHRQAEHDERLVLADFGIARSLMESRGTTIATGTPKYMAPEQADGRADARSDIYAAGVIAYELLAGRVPHPYDSVGQLLTAQKVEPVTPIGELRSDVPPALSGAIDRALSTDPDARFNSVGEWADAVRASAGGDATAAPPSTPPPVEPASDSTLGPEDLAAAAGAAGAAGLAAAAASGAPAGAVPSGAAPAGAPSGPPGPPQPSGPPPAGGPPSGPPSGPPGGPPPGDDRRRKRPVPWIPIGAAAALVALVAGIAIVTSSSNSKGSAEGEIFLTPVSSVGTLPEFTPDLVAKNPIVPVGLPKITLPTAPKVSTPPVAVPTVAGGTPGLYGGTNQLSVCDAKQLVSFLESNTDKARAWVEALGMEDVDEIPFYVKRLTDVVLQSDTRVTNHGFKNGKASPIQSVLERGTAVLVDELGVPRVRCKCGNPLTPPKAVSTTPTYKGEAWEGFDTTQVTVVVAAPTAVPSFTLTDLAGGPPIERAPGVDVDTSSSSSSSSSSSESSSSTSESSSSSSTAGPSENIAPAGSAEASSTFSSTYPAYQAVDNDPGTSWFSAGANADGDTSTYSWGAGIDSTITQIQIVGNGGNTDPATRNGFGFDSVTIEVHDTSGALVFSHDADLAGTPDPDVSVDLNAVGSTVILHFHGHEDPTCGGFSELKVFAHA